MNCWGLLWYAKSAMISGCVRGSGGWKDQVFKQPTSTFKTDLMYIMWKRFQLAVSFGPPYTVAPELVRPWSVPMCGSHSAALWKHLGHIKTCGSNVASFFCPKTQKKHNAGCSYTFSTCKWGCQCLQKVGSTWSQHVATLEPSRFGTPNRARFGVAHVKLVKWLK